MLGYPKANIARLNYINPPDSMKCAYPQQQIFPPLKKVPPPEFHAYKYVLVMSCPELSGGGWSLCSPETAFQHMRASKARQETKRMHPAPQFSSSPPERPAFGPLAAKMQLELALTSVPGNFLLENFVHSDIVSASAVKKIGRRLSLTPQLLLLASKNGRKGASN